MNQHSIDIPVPPPDEVRKRLALNLQENRLLRSLLRLSEKAAEVRNSCGHRAHPPAFRAEGRAL